MSSNNTPSSNTSEQLSTIAASLGKVVEHNRELYEKMFRSAHEESLRLLNNRLERDARALEAMRDSTSLSDLLTAQQDWLHERTRDYFEQMHKLSGLFWQLGEGAKDMAAQTASSTWTHTTSEAENAAHRAAA